MSTHDDDLSSTLKEAVSGICETASTPAAEERIVASLIARHQERTARFRRVAWSAAIAAVLLLCLALWTVLTPGRPPEPRQADAVLREADAVPHEADAVGRGATPVTNYSAVAANARVMVATGPDHPLKMGETTIGGGDRLHVWTWNADGAEELSRVLDARHAANLAITPDGKAVVTSDGRIVDVATGNAKQLPNFDGRVRGMFFTPDGSAILLFVAEDAALTATQRMLEFPSGTRRWERRGEFGATTHTAFAADGRSFFVMGADFCISRRDAATGGESAHFVPRLSNSIY